MSTDARDDLEQRMRDALLAANAALIPTADEREALVQVVWAVITSYGGHDGPGPDEIVDAILASPVWRNRKPITDAQVKAAWLEWERTQGAGSLRSMRAALEAARDAS